MITLKSLESLKGVRHAFFTRLGGVSSGLYASLNCGPGSADAPSKVTANRAQAMTMLGLSKIELLTAIQVHSATAVKVEAPWRTAPKADGLAAKAPGIALGVLTADCAPVLFADANTGVIGAAHAGWRGAKSGILEATVAAMVELGAKQCEIVAGIGPCIAKDSYEVDDDFAARFIDDAAANRGHFSASEIAGHCMFDLAGYVAGRLEGLGLKSVEVAGRDTFADEDNFFSYRRATLKGEKDYGRMLSAITLA